MEKVQVLEPIQEESDQEDETVESRKEEEENEEEKEDELAVQVGVETEEALAENEREEDDVPLRVMRPGRRSGSIRWSLSPIQFSKQKKQTETSSVFDVSTHSTDLCEETAPLPVFGSKWRLSSERLRIKVSKSVWQKQTGPDQPKRKRRSRYKEEPFPQWVENLMVNIEQATTHQLVVE